MLQAAKPLPAFAGPVTIGDPATLLQRRPDIRAAEEQLRGEVWRQRLAADQHRAPSGRPAGIDRGSIDQADLVALQHDGSALAGGADGRDRNIVEILES